MALTDALLRSLKPVGAKPYTRTDGRGLYVEVFPTGGMVWRFRYRLNGKQEKLTLGKYPDLTLKNARQLRDEAAHRVAKGESVAKAKQDAKQAHTAKMTLRDFAQGYLTDVVARDRKDPTMIVRYLEKDILPTLGRMSVEDVTVEAVRGVILAKKLHGFDAAAGQVRDVLKRMFDHAMSLGLVAVNPVSAIPMRQVHKAQSRERALDFEEVRLFLTAVEESSIRQQFKIALPLILLTLVRKSELLLAKWTHVDLDAGEWVIPVENSKTGKAHIVYLSRQAVALFTELKALSSDSELVLPGRSSLRRPFAHNAINSALREAMVGRKVAKFTVHDLRRTGSTLLHEMGFNGDHVEKALNHTIGGVRGVYNRAEYASQRREMLQRWADKLESLGLRTRS